MINLPNPAFQDLKKITLITPITFQYRARHSYGTTALETQEQVLKTTVHKNFFLVGLFGIHLLSNADIYSLY